MVIHPFAQAFERCKPMLAEAVTRSGGTSLHEVLDHILAGKAQLWEAEGAAVVTQIADGEQGRTIRYWLAGGMLRAVIELAPGIEAYGRAWGCKTAILEGRKGWARVLKSIGYIGDTELRKAL